MSVLVFALVSLAVASAIPKPDDNEHKSNRVHESKVSAGGGWHRSGIDGGEERDRQGGVGFVLCRKVCTRAQRRAERGEAGTA